MTKKILNLIISLAVSLFLVAVSLYSLNNSSSTPQQIDQATETPYPLAPALLNEVPDIDDLPFQDNFNIYQYDDPDSVVVLYITVRMGNSSDKTNYTWAEVNSFNKWVNGSRSANIEVGKADAIVQVGDENGPVPGELGYEAVVPNATIQIRGASSSAMPQKSYKIELYKNGGQWRGQSTIALNKHIFDLSRVRNKLAIDLSKQIPNMVSLRTQFIHLFVRDQTVDPNNSAFEDYGLFTQIEQVNRTFLKNHLLDPNAHLYKATSFEFYRYPDQFRLADDPLYNEDEFSHRLEIKGDHDHSKLLQMLDDINNYDLQIGPSFEKYFDEDNYFTWLAFNILMGNVDTQNQNFYLYSPLNSHKWYFIPWDYDDSLFRFDREELGEYSYQHFESGIANYWGSVLHKRVLREKAYRQKLDSKIKGLLEFLTPERIQEMLNLYQPIVKPYAFRLPDLTYLPGSRNEFDHLYAVIPSEIQNNYNLYLESLTTPMPFYLDTPTVESNSLSFDWDDAYDFSGQDIIYTFEVSTDVDFKDSKKIVAQTSLTNVTDFQMEMLKQGIYYWRVIATNQMEKTQHAFDTYFDSNSNPHDGVKSFAITENGQVIE